MDIDVIEETENPMLHRTDVRFEVTHEEATPSRLSVRDSLAAMLNKDAAEVVVQKLDTKFGMRTTVGSATVYETPEHALEVEQDYMLQRNKIESDGSGIEAVPADADDAAEGDEETADDTEASDEAADDEDEEVESAVEESGDDESEEVAEEADDEEVDSSDEDTDDEDTDAAEADDADAQSDDEAEAE